MDANPTKINTASSTDVPGEQKAPAAELRGGGIAGHLQDKGSKVVDQPEINTASSTDVPGEQKAPAAELRGGGI
ncbi:hypothetical protein, partial [Pandoraea commovens]|uniref:hypothetical protein n=1 Tax=Pandoraea commovens TaxID=2508289 RepID=UPI001C2DB5E3